VIGRLLARARRADGAAPPPLGEAAVSGGPLRGRTIHVPAPGSAYFASVAAGREDRELWDAAAALDPGAVEVVFDVGGYVGTHALSWASLFPRARVVTFEPAEVNLRWLRANLARNPDLAARVEVEAACAADFEGTAAFRSSENIGAGHSSSSTLAATASERVSPADLIAREYEVPVTTLDAVAARVGLPQVVKVDVENAEPAVLRGARRVLAAAHLLIVEVHTPRSMLECARVLGADRLAAATVLKEEPDGRVLVALRGPTA
jgi:FkbM family methyltransferase